MHRGCRVRPAGRVLTATYRAEPPKAKAETPPASLAGFGLAFTAFVGTMLGLVLADDLLLLYVFWELTTIFSFLLIGHDPARRASRAAGSRA